MGVGDVAGLPGWKFQEIKMFKREVGDLREANEVFRVVLIFFVWELDFCYW